MREDLSSKARLLLERLSRYVEAEPTTGSGEGTGADSSAALSSLEFDRIFADGEEIDLGEAWSAVGTLRAQVESERGDRDPTLSADRHARLDAAALHLAEWAVDASVEAHRQIIQDVSHDIRSPLNSILFLADALLHAPSGSLSPVQQRQVSVLYTASVALVRLVNDVIDASRLSTGREIAVDRSTFSVSGVLDDVQRLVGPLAEHRGVTLELQSADSGARVGDRQLFCRVLINLVSNAIDAAAEQGRVVVRVAEASDDRLVAQVMDDGVDADVDDLKRLIAADRAPFPDHPREGWTRGLGLGICGRLVGAASGELSVERLANGRTCFTAVLPFPAA